MTRRRDHIVKQEDYQRYLEDKMTPRERHEFERYLLDNEFEREALEGLEGLSEEKFTEDMRDLRASLAARTKRSSVFIAWRVAAALLLLGLFSFMVYYFIKQGTMEKDHILTNAERPESAQNAPLDSGDVIELQDSAEMLAYQQELEEADEKEEEAAEKDLAYTARRSEKADDDVKISVEKPEQQIETQLDLEVVGAAQEDEDVVTEPEAELPLALNLQRAETSKEAVKAIEIKPRAEESIAPAAVRLQDTEARKALSQAEEGDTRTIRGVVRAEEDNTPVPGVNVIWKGSSAGTTTDIDGNFTIDIPANKEGILVFSFIGLSTEEILVNNQEYIEVVMTADIQQLAEIVVVDPPRREKRNRSGAVSKVEEMGSDNPPQPIGGDKAFREYVRQNINYPALAVNEKIRGTVVLGFKVGLQGEITEMVVEKSLSSDFDQEAIRLVNEGPAWEPAKENGTAVVQEVKVKIRFRPPN